MESWLKKKKKKENVKIDEQLKAKDISEAEKSSENSEKYMYDFKVANTDFYESISEKSEQNSYIEVKEKSYTEEEIHKIIVQQILRVIDSGQDFNSMQSAAEEACKIIGKEHIQLISTYIKDKVSKPTYMKGKFDELGQWPIAVENSVLFEGVYVGKNTVIKDSVIMTDAKIGDNVVINKAIIGGEAKIRKDCKIGNGEKISVIASKEDIKSGSVIEAMEV